MPREVISTDISKKIQGGLIVSCQALEDEPLHSSFIMSKMAKAAFEGGACGIRANSIEDIEAIKKEVDLPIIGIIKKNYENSDVYITATMDEVDKLVDCGVDIIAMDATFSKRVGDDIDEFFRKIKKKYPDQLFMADCSTIDEMKNASKLGFDFIGTTLIGYTKQSRDLKVDYDDFKIIREALKEIDTPIIAEGNIDTPKKAKRVKELGVHAVVVGSAITRPQLITKKFSEEMRG
ncbi:MAG: N-acetylmannosamine-6-phosphate 2-epimerase [Tissierellia bacterium]|nr:N-acetylmannosamine-6-phosphate 2-epimerase [Tissierellia bacterium]